MDEEAVEDEEDFFCASCTEEGTEEGTASPAGRHSSVLKNRHDPILVCTPHISSC